MNIGFLVKYWQCAFLDVIGQTVSLPLLLARFMCEEVSASCYS